MTLACNNDTAFARGGASLKLFFNKWLRERSRLDAHEADCGSVHFWYVQERVLNRKKLELIVNRHLTSACARSSHADQNVTRAGCVRRSPEERARPTARVRFDRFRAMGRWRTGKTAEARLRLQCDLECLDVLDRLAILFGWLIFPRPGRSQQHSIVEWMDGLHEESRLDISPFVNSESQNAGEAGRAMCSP